MSETQANVLIAEMGVVALSSLIAIGGTVGGWLKVKRKAVELIDQVA